MRTLRGVGEDDDTKWWNFCVVDMLQISPRMKHAAAEDLVPATAMATTTEKTKTKNKKSKKVVKKLTEVFFFYGQMLIFYNTNFDNI